MTTSCQLISLKSSSDQTHLSISEERSRMGFPNRRKLKRKRGRLGPEHGSLLSSQKACQSAIREQELRYRASQDRIFLPVVLCPEIHFVSFFESVNDWKTSVTGALKYYDCSATNDFGMFALPSLLVIQYLKVDL